MKTIILIISCVLLCQCANPAHNKEMKDVKGNFFMESLYIWDQFKSN